MYVYMCMYVSYVWVVGVLLRFLLCWCIGVCICIFVYVCVICLGSRGVGRSDTVEDIHIDIRCMYCCVCVVYVLLACCCVCVVYMLLTYARAS